MSVCLCLSLLRTLSQHSHPSTPCPHPLPLCPPTHRFGLSEGRASAGTAAGLPWLATVTRHWAAHRNYMRDSPLRRYRYCCALGCQPARPSLRNTFPRRVIHSDSDFNSAEVICLLAWQQLEVVLNFHLAQAGEKVSPLWQQRNTISRLQL